MRYILPVLLVALGACADSPTDPAASAEPIGEPCALGEAGCMAVERYFRYDRDHYELESGDFRCDVNVYTVLQVKAGTPWRCDWH